MTATVSNHVHSGNAANRGELVQLPAAQTKAAFTNPLIKALMGTGIEPI
jgi:hypothetical protein